MTLTAPPRGGFFGSATRHGRRPEVEARAGSVGATRLAPGSALYVPAGQPVDQAIEPGGEVGRFGRLPLKTLVAALTAAGFAAKRSNSAGDYVCNRVFWDLMGALQPDAVGGFVHVPEGIDTASAIEVVARTLLAPAS